MTLEEAKKIVKELRPLKEEVVNGVWVDDKITIAIETVLAALPEWRPIDEEAKNGKPFLCYHEQSKSYAVAYVNKHGEFRHIDGAQIYEPTKYQPLPAPPQTKENE